MCKQACSGKCGGCASSADRVATEAADREKWISVNAMSLMYSLHKAAGDSLVQLLQDASDGGFVDGLIELNTLAIKAAEVELALFAAFEDGWPGVFQYEVTEALGAAMAKALSSTDDCLLDVGVQKLGDLAYEFIRQGTEDSAKLPEFARVIGEVLPKWTVEGASV